MESLPLLPGYNFTGEDPSLKDHKLTQKFKFLNGIPVCHDKLCLRDESCECPPEIKFDPELTYGKKTNHLHQIFQPHYVMYHHKVLSFEAYFKIGIFGSPDEYCRVRRVFINYYLEDDSMSVNEPKTPNCGFKQGKVVRRHKIPNPRKPGQCYSWKDLNVGKDIEIYGTVYRTTSCDAFTREFLNSQGVDVNDFETVPPDPYTENRKIAKRNELPQPTSGPNPVDLKLFTFLEYDRMLLFFKAVYNDNPNYRLYYYLGDNTIALFEKMPRIEGGRNRRVLRRTKVPKDWSDVPLHYAGAYHEITDAEVKEYYAPKDFIIGETVFIYGRRIFLYDCDPFTRTYYCKFLGIEQPPAIDVTEGQCDSTLDGVCGKKPDERHTDVVRLLYNFPRKLRYSAVLDTIRPEDKDRKFTIEYGLHDGSFRIFEVPSHNSGQQAGRLLNWNRVQKPGTEEYYTPEDFYIGAKLEVFGRQFLITGTEVYVYNYMLENPDKFSVCLVSNIREYLKKKGLIKDTECHKKEFDRKDSHKKDDEVDQNTSKQCKKDPEGSTNDDDDMLKAAMKEPVCSRNRMLSQCDYWDE